MAQNTDKGKKTADRILKESTRIFAKSGFSSTSLQEIADQAGVQKAVILYYFRDKYGLFSACIDDVLRVFGEISIRNIHDLDPPLVRLEKNFLANLTLATDYPQHMQLMVFLYYTAMHSAEFREPYRKILEGSRLRYRAILEAGIREGVLKPPFPVDLAAELLHEVIVGSLIPFATDRTKSAEKRLREKWKAAIIYLAGCGPKALTCL